VYLYSDGRQKKRNKKNCNNKVNSSNNKRTTSDSTETAATATRTTTTFKHVGFVLSGESTTLLIGHFTLPVVVAVGLVLLYLFVDF